MGHQLWTSPITGYRRKGTRLAELRSLLGAGITARAVLEPLQSCPADAAAAEMASLLRDRDFDVAGVQLRREGPVIGFVSKNSLQNGFVRDHVQPITAEHLVSDATPLGGLLSVLKSRERIFVLIGPEVRGIITRADLNKPPVRLYLFGLFSLLEMHLNFWIRAAYGDDGWQKELSVERLKKAERLQIERRSRNHDATLLECLQFCDKRDLVITRGELRESLGLGPADQAQALFERGEDLRNLLAHSQQDLVAGASWEELIELMEWVETVVHRSDELVEQKASQAAGNIREALWASA